MGWIREEYECRLPSVGRRGIGSVWRCRRCGAHWELTDKRSVGILEYVTWRGPSDEDSGRYCRECKRVHPTLSDELAAHGDPPS
jgi:hypothetical protein